MNKPEDWDERAALTEPWAAALWSEQGQRKRFEAIERHLPLRAGDVLLDYGCGTGALCDFLPSIISYVGWDWSPKMRERAAAEHPSGIILDKAPTSSLYDHVICCGTFNLAEGWTHERTWSVVQLLWERHTATSLIVSLYRGTDPYSLHYGLKEVQHFLWRRSITRFEIDAAYLDNDLLVCLYK